MKELKGIDFNCQRDCIIETLLDKGVYKCRDCQLYECSTSTLKKLLEEKKKTPKDEGGL
ncbi:Fur-regulated basic protein FbpA [Salipaludibacillus sp. HK11]|uniref:Fur-regulated basic protein FbpA n=1 Tax=Salipaludibacillus sp. HK11 TaxID=3394320 RepID=UPI0039FDC104